MELSTEFFMRLGRALGIGVLIGLERALGQAVYASGWRFGRLVGPCLGLASGAGLLGAVPL